MAFMLEASFSGHYAVRLEPGAPADSLPGDHFWWPLGQTSPPFGFCLPNSWLQTPAGGIFVDGKFVVQDYFKAIANPFMVNSFLHMFFATFETSLFVIGGISAWFFNQQAQSQFVSASRSK